MKKILGKTNGVSCNSAAGLFNPTMLMPSPGEEKIGLNSPDSAGIDTLRHCMIQRK
ncbi:MAG: hypothetical protein HYT94_00015 [Parcubacteria group bacterium]|nr:hypothetical protein [Parcubacteria group bacterium]